jgi:hypothetical protein
MVISMKSLVRWVQIRWINYRLAGLEVDLDTLEDYLRDSPKMRSTLHADICALHARREYLQTVAPITER